MWSKIMQMSQEHIKRECELIYQTIKNSNNRLDEIRKICQHPNTFEGTYSWRPGSYMESIICSDCGKQIQIL